MQRVPRQSKFELTDSPENRFKNTILFEMDDLAFRAKPDFSGLALLHFTDDLDCPVTACLRHADEVSLGQFRFGG
jgi:hypothetical protein